MPASWMSQADERVLEYFDEEGKATAEEMAKDQRVNLNRNYITQRLSKLYKAGLFEKTGRGLYQITGEGTEFLTGARDLRNLEEPE